MIKPTLSQSIGQTYKEFFYLQSEIAVGCFEFFNIILEMSLYLQLWNVSAYLLWLSVDLYKWNGQIYNPILPVLKKLLKSPIFSKLLEKGRLIFDIAYVQCTLLHKSRTLVTVC